MDMRIPPPPFAFCYALVIALLFALVITKARGGEQQMCQLERGVGGGWHFRTKVGPHAGRCWYLGERMKPRSELYWAEVPARPTVNHLPWTLELRYRGGGEIE
jgi:hypothetical protein